MLKKKKKTHQAITKFQILKFDNEICWVICFRKQERKNWSGFFFFFLDCEDRELVLSFGGQQAAVPVGSESVSKKTTTTTTTTTKTKTKTKTQKKEEEEEE